MTLTTRIAIVDPTPAREVFDACRRLIGGEQAAYLHQDGEYRNKIAQGLPALLWMYYGLDAPLVPDPKYADDPDERSYYPPVNEWSIMVSFDTAYAYQAGNGAGCSDLHAYIVQELGRWLTARRLTWYWYHEYTGTWHPSTDPVTILGDPVRGRLGERAFRLLEQATKVLG